MKTIFTEEELSEFFTKLIREIHGEYLLLPLNPTSIDPLEMLKAMSDPTYASELNSKISKAQGIVIGKTELYLKIIDFFDLIDKSEM